MFSVGQADTTGSGQPKTVGRGWTQILEDLDPEAAWPRRAQRSEAAFVRHPKRRLSWKRKAADTGTPEQATCPPSPVHKSQADSTRLVSRACLSSLRRMLNPSCPGLGPTCSGVLDSPAACPCSSLLA